MDSDSGDPGLLDTLVCQHCGATQSVGTERAIWACTSCMVKNEPEDPSAAGATVG